jgi:hypothetical protein
VLFQCLPIQAAPFSGYLIVPGKQESGNAYDEIKSLFSMMTKSKETRSFAGQSVAKRGT